MKTNHLLMFSLLAVFPSGFQQAMAAVAAAAGDVVIYLFIYFFCERLKRNDLINGKR